MARVFVYFGLLKQVNVAVEGKTIGVIFPPFFVSVILGRVLLGPTVSGWLGWLS